MFHAASSAHELARFPLSRTLTALSSRKPPSAIDLILSVSDRPARGAQPERRVRAASRALPARATAPIPIGLRRPNGFVGQSQTPRVGRPPTTHRPAALACASFDARVRHSRQRWYLGLGTHPQTTHIDFRINNARRRRE